MSIKPGCQVHDVQAAESLQRQREISACTQPGGCSPLHASLLERQTGARLPAGRLDGTICHTDSISHPPGDWGDHLCQQLAGFIQRNNKLLVFLRQEVVLKHRGCQRQAPSLGQGAGRQVLPPLMSTFQRWCIRPLRKTSLACPQAGGLFSF